MTCIVGFVEGHTVWMGGDSAAVAGLDIYIRANQKVFRNGPMLFGVAGSPRLSQLLQYALTIPDHDPRVGFDKYLTTTFIDAVRECLKKYGCAEKEKEVEQAAGHSAWLVASEGQLRAVYADYQIGIPSEGFIAVGCGDQIARGALYATPHLKGRERAELALQAAERCSAGVRAPFHIECLRPVTPDSAVAATDTLVTGIHRPR